MNRSLALLLLWLVAAAGVAGVFAVQKIEEPGSPIGRPVASKGLSPNGDGHGDSATMELFLKRRDHISVDVVDNNRDFVANIVKPSNHRGKVNVEWDGLTSKGELSKEGIYHFRVKLDRAGRTINLPQDVRLDLTPPRMRKVSIDTSMLTKFNMLRIRLEAKDADGAYFFYVENGKEKILPAKRMIKLGTVGDFTKLRVSVRFDRPVFAYNNLTLVVFDQAKNRTLYRVRLRYSIATRA